MKKVFYFLFFHMPLKKWGGILGIRGIGEYLRWKCPGGWAFLVVEGCDLHQGIDLFLIGGNLYFLVPIIVGVIDKFRCK